MDLGRSNAFGNGISKTGYKRNFGSLCVMRMPLARGDPARQSGACPDDLDAAGGICTLASDENRRESPDLTSYSFRTSSECLERSSQDILEAIGY